MTTFNRRKFLVTGAACTLPAVLPFTNLNAAAIDIENPTNTLRTVYFGGDADFLDPSAYVAELMKYHQKNKIETDRYGQGGTLAAMEKKFAELTGKEKAIFMPTGTMANELAIAVLSGDKSKVYVQDESHVYRDEADAAQSVFNKRLMPLAKGETYFTAQQLKDAIENLPANEVFKTGVGAVSIENPVRRTNGRVIPIKEIEQITSYCKSQNIPIHLDGARLFIASVFTGISVKEYSSYFDTVYISLYKYFGANAGAVLCGPAKIIDQMPYLIKVHGGNMASNWANAAMVMHKLESFENNLKQAIQLSKEVFEGLNKLPGVKVIPVDSGTNIYQLEISKEIDSKKMTDALNKEFNIRVPRINEKNQGTLSVNESLLHQTPSYIINAFKQSISRA